MLPALSHAQTDWIQYWYEQGDCKKGLFAAVVWPNSLWQPNRQTTGRLVLTSYQEPDIFEM